MAKSLEKWGCGISDSAEIQNKTLLIAYLIQQVGGIRHESTLKLED